MNVPKLKRLPEFASLGFDQPQVLSNGVDVKLAFSKKLPLVVDGREKALIAAVRFEVAIACYFGLPNDEALSGHPLSRIGLEPYRAYEVLGSAWIEELSAKNSVHPNHRSDSFADMHHFLFTFKDELFECVARGYQLVFEV